MSFFDFKIYDIIILISALLAISFLLISLKFKNKITILLFCFFCIVFILILFFFRNPQRKINPNDNYILSPCDGKIVSIDKMDNNRTQIYIFLSLFDVHRFRNPISGKVKTIIYKKGKFNMAFNKKAINENESNEIFYEAKNGNIIKIKQIAGHIARRIFCNIKENDIVNQGDLFGIISFGSGCLIDMPSNYKLKINEKSKIKAGLTVIATVNENKNGK